MYRPHTTQNLGNIFDLSMPLKAKSNAETGFPTYFLFSHMWAKSTRDMTLTFQGHAGANRAVPFTSHV